MVPSPLAVPDSPLARTPSPIPGSPGDVSQGADDLAVTGCAVVYRLYDVGYEIDLDRAATLSPTGAAARFSLAGSLANALVIPNPPLLVGLGRFPLSGPLDGYTADLTARVYDFGAVALRARLSGPGNGVPWKEFAEYGARVTRFFADQEVFQAVIRRLMEALGPAIDRPSLASVTEDYVVFRISKLTRGGVTASPAAVSDHQLAELLLQETRPLSPGALKDLLPHRFSYYEDDLAVLTWEHAFVAAPGQEETDVEWVLEFANAQLLELRFYDAALDAELPRMYDDVEGARHGWGAWISRRFAPILTRLARLVADTTEVVERVENALKVTDDVYLARVYSTALEVFRSKTWRSGIDRKLGIVRDTYGMLNDEAQANRNELLEIMIVVLIVAELVLALR